MAPEGEAQGGARRRLKATVGTVRVRTTVAAVAVVALALLVGAVALVLGMRHALTNGVRDAARVRAADAAAVLESGSGAARVTSDANDDVLIQVLDGRRRVLASSPALACCPTPMTRLEPGDSAQVSPDGQDEEYLAVAAAADTDTGRLTVIAARTLESVEESTGAVTRLLVVGLPLLLVVVAVTTWRVVGRSLAPVEAIRRGVDEVSAAELYRRVPAPVGNDEIARLAATMNRMLERLERGQAQQRRFIADASHELRSPVASIRQHTEVARSHPERTSVGDLAETVHAENLRVERLVDDLLLLAQADEHTLELRRRPVDLDDLVFDEARRLREFTPLRIDTSEVSAGRMTGDSAALRRVLRNLGDNAARHARARVVFALGEDADGTDGTGVVVLGLEDDGPGIAPEHRQRVFERFVRLDDARARDAGGSGLGLAIVAEVVAAHHGTVTVTDSRLGGARFELRFPLSDGA